LKPELQRKPSAVQLGFVYKNVAAFL
jgi:hypothetical protein